MNGTSRAAPTKYADKVVGMELMQGQNPTLGEVSCKS